MRRLGGVFRIAVFWGLTIGLQWLSGAYASEAADEPDEPAHFVTGLMVRDYVSSGGGQSPIAFARDYYRHFPKVAIGHWPPVFYVEQAIWMLMFPATRSSVLAMIALQAALLGALIWMVLEQRFGRGAAWAGALALITLPGVASASARVMTEVPLALLMFLAILAWGRYLDTGQARFAVGFGLWSAAALLAKGTGLALAGVPLLSIWLSGRLALLRRVWTWCPAAIVLAACAPWYLLAPDAMQERVQSAGGFGLLSRQNRFPIAIWGPRFGWAVTMLALTGLAVTFYRRIAASAGGPDRTPDAAAVNGVWACAPALLVSASVMPLFFLAWETRHILESAPAIVLMAAVGLAWAVGRLPFFSKLTPAWGTTILTVAAMLTIGVNLLSIPARRQQVLGYRSLVSAIAAGNRQPGAAPARAIVICGHPLVEGVMVMEMAQRRLQPRPYILRGTKLFAKVSWMGLEAELRVHNAGQVNSLLESLPVDLIVVDRRRRSRLAYQPLLEEALASHPEQWEQVHHGQPDGAHLAVFRRMGRDGQRQLSESELAARLEKALPEPIQRH